MDDMFAQFFGGGHHGFGGDPFGHHHGGHRQQQRQQYEDIFENTDVIKLDLGTVFQFYRRAEIWIMLFYDVSKKES